MEEPGLAGGESWFVVLPDGSITVEDGDADAQRFVAAIALEPPYRACAVRRDGDLWAVGARSIETVELADDPGGDTIELSWDGVERAVRIDGRPTLARVAELERLATRHATYVVTATRIAGTAWEVVVTPL